MRRAVLMTRQAISPRFAIRIRLNMFFLLELWAGSSPAMWHAGTRLTNPWYSKNRQRQRSRIGLAAPGGDRGLISAGITLKTPARIGVRDRLHQLADLGLQIFIGHDQRADGRSLIAAAGRDGLIDGGFQPVMVLYIRLWRRGHDGIPWWAAAGYVPILFSQSQCVVWGITAATPAPFSSGGRRETNR